MIKTFWVAAILSINAVDTAGAQDSVKTPLNSIELNVRYESYPQGLDRTYVFVQYGRKIKSADIFGKVLRYTIGKEVSYLFETESYLKFKKQGYGYFDAAYSSSVFLPNYRLRAEIFQNWRKFEYSIGLGLVKPHIFKNIPFITGTIGYYFADYFIYVRPTFSYVDEGVTKSIFIQARRYFNKTDFIALSGLRGADTGASRNINAIANTFGLDTYLVRMNGQFKKGLYKFGAGFDYGGFFIPSREGYLNFTGFDVFVNREF